MKEKAAITVSQTSKNLLNWGGKKLEFSNESSSETSGSDIQGEGDYNGSDVQSDQDSDHIQNPRDASNFSEKKLEAW